MDKIDSLIFHKIGKYTISVFSNFEKTKFELCWISDNQNCQILGTFDISKAVIDFWKDLDHCSSKEFVY